MIPFHCLLLSRVDGKIRMKPKIKVYHALTSAVLENRILPSLYRSRKHSEKDVSSVVIHCRKFFSHFPHIGFGRITHNTSLPDR